jgi:hypothetical protein
MRKPCLKTTKTHLKMPKKFCLKMMYDRVTYQVYISTTVAATVVPNEEGSGLGIMSYSMHYKTVLAT